MKNKIYILTWLTFIEGASMLTIEFSASRLLANYFGSSLFVWIFVLCITLMGLTIGYFFGNFFYRRYGLSKGLMLLSFFLFTWIFYDYWSLWCIANFSMMLSLFFTTIYLLFFSMAFIGIISVMLVNEFQNKTNIKNTYGYVLGISTLGSIAGILISVFILYPLWGVLYTVIAYAFGLLVFSIFMTEKKDGFWGIVLLIIMLGIIVVFILHKKNNGYLYFNEGAMSMVVVKDDSVVNERYLLVNNIIQTKMNLIKPDSLMWPYMRYIDSVIKKQCNKKNCLMLGLGGGLLANSMVSKNYDVTGVEIDPRIVFCAEKFFYLDNKVKVFCMDAINFLYQHHSELYDLIVFDMFKSEEQPSYLLTQKNLGIIKSMLKDDSSLLIINWHGYFLGQKGYGTCMLVNTLKNLGFYVSLHSTDIHRQDYANIIIVCSKSFNRTFLSNITIKDNNTPAHSEQDFLMDYYNAFANYEWRKNYLWWIKNL